MVLGQGARGKGQKEWRGGQTWNEHEHAVGNHQHIHRLEPLETRQDTPVRPHVHDQPHIEQETKPADRRGNQGQIRLPRPPPRLVPTHPEDCPRLYDGRQHVERDGGQHQANRHERRGQLVQRRPQAQHRPRLHKQRGEDEHGDGDAERGGGGADVEGRRLDVADAAGGEDEEAEKARREKDGEQDYADGVEDQRGEVDEGGQPPEADPRSHGEQDDQHDEAGTDLGAIEDGERGGVEVAGGDGARAEWDGCRAVRGEDVGGLVGRVEGDARRRGEVDGDHLDGRAKER